MARAPVYVLLTVLLAFSGCGGSDGGTSAAGNATVTELTRVDELATAFDADKGKPRLVLLLSPT